MPISTWSIDEDQTIKSLYGSVPSHAIGRLLNRSASSIRNRCCVLGLKGAMKSGLFQIRHGYNRTENGPVRAEYRAWRGILQRCYSENDKGYKRYGGRGITVDPTWFSFQQFIADMGDKPSPDHWLERIDNNGPYAPWNCRWATPKEQGNNRRNNKILEFNGRALTISQWADVLGVSRKLIGNRLLAGWSTDAALTVPVGRRR